MAEREEKMQQMQALEHSLQALMAQKQSMQMQLAELESAVAELAGKESAYRIVGNIMVSAKAPELLKELEEKKELVEMRISSVTKQENSVKKKAEQLQKDVLESMRQGS